MVKSLRQNESSPVVIFLWLHSPCIWNLYCPAHPNDSVEEDPTPLAPQDDKEEDDDDDSNLGIWTEYLPTSGQCVWKCLDPKINDMFTLYLTLWILTTNLWLWWHPRRACQRTGSCCRLHPCSWTTCPGPGSAGVERATQKRDTWSHSHYIQKIKNFWSFLRNMKYKDNPHVWEY